MLHQEYQYQPPDPKRLLIILIIGITLFTLIYIFAE